MLRQPEPETQGKMKTVFIKKKRIVAAGMSPKSRNGYRPTNTDHIYAVIHMSNYAESGYQA